ncbi:MAG TPA: class I tRNA ligase family protein, partial [Xanthomonadales bacterium]|nr:class I tRNA ligase family protein [Xanthomonadales bacterium]
GAFRFIRRLWNLVTTHVEQGPTAELDVAALNDSQKEMRRLLHDAIAKVSDDVSRRYTFNTAIAAIMELSNHLARFEDASDQGRAVQQEAWLAVVRMLNPIIPHACERLWAALGETTPLFSASWPVVDESARKKLQVELVIQVNGKVRGRLEAAPGISKESALEQALQIDNVQRHLDGLSVRKVILVPDRLLNIVVG